jgi:4a-hydroxytetrahydrobiopterin dehydratase
MKHLPGWSNVDNSLSKMYTFTNFARAMQFTNMVAQAAEAINHHPDILIRYNKVTLTLTTHDSDGVTINDVQLAATCDDEAEQIPS